MASEEEQQREREREQAELWEKYKRDGHLRRGAQVIGGDDRFIPVPNVARRRRKYF